MKVGSVRKKVAFCPFNKINYHIFSVGFHFPVHYSLNKLFYTNKQLSILLGFLAHLSRRLIGELIVYQWLRRPSVRPSVRPSSVVRQHFQTSSSLKLLGQLNSYFIWRLLRMGERKFVQMVLVTWPRWPPRPYMVKTLKKSSSPEPEGRWPWDLVCSIGVVGPTKFVQIMILGWPWPT